jgi:hypothetical protein
LGLLICKKGGDCAESEGWEAGFREEIKDVGEEKGVEGEDWEGGEVVE